MLAGAIVSLKTAVKQLLRLLLERDSLLLLTYLVVNVLVIFLNPAQHVTENEQYFGRPKGDLSEQVRLHMANETKLGKLKSNVMWEPYLEICGFTLEWNTPGGASGKYFNQAHKLCDIVTSVDYYAVEGVNTLTPLGIDGPECGEVDRDGGWSTYRFCDGSYRTQHIFPLAANLTSLGLPRGTPVTDVELRLYPNGESGIYENGNWFVVCGELEEDGLITRCNLTFNFYGDISFEVKNSTVEIRSAIFKELGTLAGRDDLDLPPLLSASGMEDGICQELVSPEDRDLCLIKCTPSYPYPSSDCVGTYELKIVDEKIHLRWAIILGMVTAVTICWFILLCWSLGMRSRRGRCRRGYLGPGGSCQRYYKNELDPVDPPQGALEPEEPLMEVMEVVTVANTDVPAYFDVPVARHGSLTKLDEEVTFVKLSNETFGKAMLDESSGGDHLAWARGFSLVDAIGCVMTLWTVHFLANHSKWGAFYWVAALVSLSRWLEESDLRNCFRSLCPVRNCFGSLLPGVRVTPKNRSSSAPPLPMTLAVMEVLYNLSCPYLKWIGLCVTGLWTAVILVSCARFVFLLGYEPLDDRDSGGQYANKVSTELAGAVSDTMDAPYARAGNWVRGPEGKVGGFRFYRKRITAAAARLG